MLFWIYQVTIFIESNLIVKAPIFMDMEMSPM